MNNSEENFLREIPEKVFVKVTNEKGLPVISLSILLIFKSDYKNDFAYVLTKKNAQNGSFELNRAEIISKAEKDANMFIMDYGSIERCFTSKIQVKIRNADEIQGAIKTYSEYSAINPDLFPHEHLKDLRYNLEETKKLEKSGELKRLQVKCWAEPRGLATFEVLPI